jgi:hypothetical protein
VHRDEDQILVEDEHLRHRRGGIGRRQGECKFTRTMSRARSNRPTWDTGGVDCTLCMRSAAPCKSTLFTRPRVTLVA